MDHSDFIKSEIIRQYGSVMHFAEEIGVPYTTLSGALSRPNGIGGMAVDKAIKVYHGLGLNIDTEYGKVWKEKQKEKRKTPNIVDINEMKLLQAYRNSTPEARELIVDFCENFLKFQKENITDEVLILPMTTLRKSEKPEEPEEEEYIDLDYFPMAAGMGSGYFVDNPMRESIRCPISAIPDHTDFVILAEGNSMEPMFSSGDKLFIQSTPSVQIGEIGLFNYQGNEMVKRLGDGQLESINEEYEPIKILYPDEFFVQGKVLGKMES